MYTFEKQTNKNVMKTLPLNTRLSQIRVGDYFECSTKEERTFEGGLYYGHYNWARVNKIHITKSGRLKIQLELEYQTKDGVIIVGINQYSNGAVLPYKTIGSKI
jgi:hypothetical protein